MTQGNIRRADTSLTKAFWLSIVVLTRLFRGRNVQQPGSQAVEPRSGGSTASADRARRAEIDAARLLSTVRTELRWWFPSSLGVASAATVLLVYIANRYYTGFYLAFGLDPVQVGVSRTDILLRILPLTVVLAFGLLFLRVFFIALKVAATSSAGTTKAAPKSGRKRMFLKRSGPGGLALFAVLAFWLVAAWAGWANREGKLDARQVVTSKTNYVYASEWQMELGTKTLVATIRWVGPPDVNQIADEPTPDSRDHYTMGRVIVQVGETTVYFDLMDCQVHSVPTIDISLTYGPTSFTGNASGAEIKGISSCKSDIA